MNIRNLCIISVILVFSSCTVDEKARAEEQAKDLKKKELVFTNIAKSWNFNTVPVNATSQRLVAEWPAWRDLLRELSQKPQSSIGAFQKKSKTLSVRVTTMSANIPSQFNIPEVRSRISVLTTKINALNLFINLDDIPDQKVAQIIIDINAELASLQHQLDETIRVSLIPKEEGESEMIRMLDTSRAVPTKKDIIRPTLE